MTEIDWEAQAKRADDLVDRFFGEPVRLIPIAAGGKFSGPTIDNTRQQRETVGIFMTDKEIDAAGIGGQATEGATVKYGLSIQKIFFDGFRKGDHVLFLKPMRANLKCEVILPGPSETGRMAVGLTRLE